MKLNIGRFKYTIGAKDRRHIMVKAREYALLRAYGKQEGITSVEPTHYILGLGFAQIENLPMKKPWWRF